MREAVVEEAKRVAELRGTSVWAMFSQFVASMAASARRPVKLGPLTRKLSGVVKLPAETEYKELLSEALAVDEEFEAFYFSNALKPACSK